MKVLKAFRKLVTSGIVTMAILVLLGTMILTTKPQIVRATPVVYSGGSGTSEDPYRISTVNDWTTLSSTSTDWNKYFILTADIDFEGSSLTPVGNTSTPFTGSFNGNGHVINDGYINQEWSSYIGVFGYVGSTGLITALGVDNINVNARSHVGGLVGYNQGTITGCHANGAVSGGSDYMMGGYAFGGLVGGNQGGTITESYATGSVIASGGFEGGMEVGGLVGYSYQGTISRCYATSTVSTTHDIYSYGYENGGLVGYLYESIVTDSYATGTVDGYYDCGGLIGAANSSIITNCYATGAVTGQTNIGGLVGYTSVVTVTSSYWDKETTGQASSTAGEGRTTDEMTYEYASNTYVSWNFSGTWVADSSNVHNGYPYLNWQPFVSTPEIDIQGNSISITNGDTSPSTEDYTDFGDTAVSTGNLTRTFTLRNIGSADLNLNGDPLIEIDGTNADDFTVNQQPLSTITAGNSTSFRVTFHPSTTGIRIAMISIASDDANENPYNFTIQGTGKAGLAVTGITAENKAYDGEITATLDTSHAGLLGVIGDDEVTLVTTPASGVFTDKNVGTDKIVSISGLTLIGADAGNYSLTQPTATANITKKSLAVSAIATNKVYDGLTAANVSLSDNRISGDIFTISYTTGAFSDRNVGIDKTINVGGISVSGSDAANYDPNGATTTTANITARGITVIAVTDNKTYDKTNNSSGIPTIITGSLVDGDSAEWIQSFSDVNVGTGKTITPSGTVDDDNNGNNYSVTFAPIDTGFIVAKILTLSGITIDDKIYDGDAEATINTENATLSGVVNGDNVSLDLNGAVGTFSGGASAKSVGTAKTVSISNISLTGADSENYDLNIMSATADITPKVLTVTGITADNKSYDGTTIAALNLNDAGLSGVVTGDTVTLNSTSAVGAFNNKNPGEVKPISVTGLILEGGDAGNYALTQPTTSADITAATITIEALGITIANGDNVPSTADATDFGLVSVGTIKTVTFTVNNTGKEILNLTGAPLVAIDDGNTGYFTIGSEPNPAINTGNMTSFSVEFAPRSAGEKTAVVTVVSNDPLADHYVFTIKGTGNEVMQPPPVSTPTTSVPTPTPTPTPTPAPSPTVEPPTTEPVASVQLTVEIEGETDTSRIRSDGSVEGEIRVSSPDKQITFTIPQGTTVLVGNDIPTQIVIRPESNPPEAPVDQNIIGIAYECLPEGTTFSPAIELVWSYNPADFPEDGETPQPKVAFYNESAGKWEIVESVVDPISKTITAKVTHFSVYAIISPSNLEVEKPVENPASSNSGWLIALIVLAGIVVTIGILLIAIRKKKSSTV